MLKTILKWLLIAAVIIVGFTCFKHRDAFINGNKSEQVDAFKEGFDNCGKVVDKAVEWTSSAVTAAKD